MIWNSKCWKQYSLKQGGNPRDNCLRGHFPSLCNYFLLVSVVSPKQTTNRLQTDHKQQEKTLARCFNHYLLYSKLKVHLKQYFLNKLSHIWTFISFLNSLQCPKFSCFLLYLLYDNFCQNQQRTKANLST